MCRALVLQGVLIHHGDYFGLPTYPMNINDLLYAFSVEHNISFNNITMYRVGKGSVAHELKVFRV